MAFFFFLVGLEIKRELLVGELATFRRAVLPAAAALGGMVVPALIYTLVNLGGPGSRGWGIPMATDIAFALGIMAVLGRRVPESLKIFLTAVAIVDDIGAVLVIAIFYSHGISYLSLGVAGIVLALLIVANRLGVRHPVPYVLLAVPLWLAFLQSGIHATIAGVLFAMTIPAQSRINSSEFLAVSRSILNEFERERTRADSVLRNHRQSDAIQALEVACERVLTPLQRFERTYHPWVVYAIVPVFALANAGVHLSGNLGQMLTDRVTLGVILGLVLGKQIGITLATWLAVRTGVADLPRNITWPQVYGVGWVAGIGFTMSLFIAELAFAGSEVLDRAKLGILVASIIAGAVGWALLRALGKRVLSAQEEEGRSGH